MNQIEQSRLADLENALREMPNHVTEMPVEHYQIEGVYCRSLFIPAGMCAVGKVHNHEHIAILAQGTMRLFDEEFTAPYICITPAGTKRAVYAVTDCTFINVIRTDLTEITEIEAEAVSSTFEEFETRKLLCHS